MGAALVTGIFILAGVSFAITWSEALGDLSRLV
jgi:hypothetical protein